MPFVTLENEESDDVTRGCPTYRTGSYEEGIPSHPDGGYCTPHCIHNP